MDDGSGAVAAEELTELSFRKTECGGVFTRSMKSCGVKRGQSGLGEMRILRDEVFGRGAGVSEVTPTAARDQDLSPDLGIVLKDDDAAAAIASSDRTEKPCRPAADDRSRRRSPPLSMPLLKRRS